MAKLTPEELRAQVAAQRTSHALTLKAPARFAKEEALDTAPRIPGRVGPPPVRHIPQAWPDGAPADYVDKGFCAPTCMAMLARAYGLGSHLSDAELVMRLSRIAYASRGGGTDNAGLFKMAAHLRFKSARFSGENPEWMAKQLAQNRYIIASGNPYVLPGSERAGRFGAHAVIVEGMDGDGNFLVKNPWNIATHVASPRQMQKFLLTHTAPHQAAFWQELQAR